MIKLWSELPRARSRELLADLTTLIWVVFWSIVVWRLFVFLSSFAEAGRSVQAGGETMIQGGRNLGESLAGLPLSARRSATSPAMPSPGPGRR